MRIMWSFCIMCILLGSSCTQRPALPPSTSWDQKSGVFRWWEGEVSLPAGFTYERVPSDTIEGRFTSPDGKVIVDHDIGSLAGAFANRKNALFFQEHSVEGARVWTARRKWGPGLTKTLVAVTFPDNGCANFFLETSNSEDAAVIDALARSFRPNATKPNSPCGR